MEASRRVEHKQIANRSIIVALIIAVFALAGCGLSSPESPQVAANETYDFQWSRGDDAAPLVDELTYANFDLQIGTHDGGTTLKASDLSECVLDEVYPSGTLQLGDQVEVTVDCTQKYWTFESGGDAWSGGSGDAWPEFSDAYRASFVAGCVRIFEESPNGQLFGGDEWTYTSEDCTEFDSRDALNASEIPSVVPEDPTYEGDRIGFIDGCIAYFEWAGPDLRDGDFVADTETCYNQ